MHDEPTEWPPEGGICAQSDPELFHVGNQYTASQVRKALNQCAICDVRSECDAGAQQFTRAAGAMYWWCKAVVGGRYYNRDGDPKLNIWGDPLTVTDDVTDDDDDDDTADDLAVSPGVAA